MSSVTNDPARPLLQAGVYILLCLSPIFLSGYLFLFVANDFAGSILAVFVAAMLGNLFCLRIFESAGLDRMGLPFNRAGLRNSGTGLVLGFAGAALVMLIPLLSGIAREQVAAGAQANWRAQLFVPFMLVIGAAAEEILFRGFGFQVLLRAFGPFTAVLPIGVLFGLLHANNPHASVIGIVNTAGFGMLFGYAFIRSHDIWFPIGMHIGWNLTLLFFGANISGIKMRVTSYEMIWTGSPVWTGGEYGPEGSLLATFALAFLGAAVWKAGVVRQTAYLVDSPREDE